MTPQRANPLHLLAAFGSGGLLTLMIHFNGELARYGNALFASWTAHGTGTVAALIFLAVLRRRAPAGDVAKARTPFWAYLGGLSGAATVMLASAAVNSPLALSGTLALGLVGQMIFSLAADRWGLFGLPMRRPGARDFAALGLVLAGSAIIILFGKGAA
ncbi:DMT family transporter [Mesorhizobium sp. YR577]|uniref:DMT family transporter n=1 Tax=Mesorhizobium sp. YR577 TaxID=1884373 RepID=UPI0008E712EB|nr:DMT family transporter [Mesorhizobium sp. YR577]SFT74165.1 transporter family-2 protein [Mesorhizobium sp. YR577]